MRSIIGLTMLLLLSMSTIAFALSVTMTWDYTQGSDPAVGFVVYRQTDCVGPFTKLTATALPVTTLTYRDTAVVSSKTYCWQVTAIDAIGQESTPSNVLSFQLPALPASPSNLRGTIQ